MNNEPITFTVYGKPAQMGSKKAFYIKAIKQARIVDANNDRQKAWAASVADTASRVMDGRDLLAGPIVLTVEFYFARPKGHYGSGKNASVLKSSAPAKHVQSPDLDKLVRCLGDAMTGIVYRDDRQVYEIQASRHWTTSQECAVVSVSEFDEPF